MTIKSLFPRIQSEFWGRVGIVALGTIVSHALLFLTFPFIALLYDPGQFGKYSVYVAFLSFFGIVATLRYEMAIPIAATNKESRTLVVLTLLWAILACSSLLAFYFLATRFFPEVFGAGSLQIMFGFLVVGSLLEGFIRPLRAWNLRRGNMPALAYAKVSQSLGLAVCQLAFSFLGQIGLFLGDLVGRSLGVVVHLLSALRRGEQPMAKRRVAEIREVATRYRRFPFYSTWATICIQLVNCGPLLFLAAIFDPKTAGAFAMAQRAILGPMLIISMAITQVYIAESSKLIREDSAALSNIFWRTSARMLVVGLLPILAIAILGPLVVRHFFDVKWHDSGVFLPLLVPATIGQFVVGPVYQTLDLLQKQKWALTINGMGVLLIGAVFYCVSALQYTPGQAIFAYSVSIFIFNGCLFTCAAYAVAQYAREHELVKCSSPLPGAWPPRYGKT